jgi:hypothetical protein
MILSQKRAAGKNRKMVVVCGVAGLDHHLNWSVEWNIAADVSSFG